MRGVAGAGAARPAAASSSGRESRACRLGSSAAGPAHSAASPVHSAATRMSIAPTSGSNLPRTKYMPSSSGKIEKHLERCRILSSSCSSHRFSRRHALTTRSSWAAPTAALVHRPKLPLGWMGRRWGLLALESRTGLRPPPWCTGQGALTGRRGSAWTAPDGPDLTTPPSRAALRP